MTDELQQQVVQKQPDIDGVCLFVNEQMKEKSQMRIQINK